MEKRHIQISFFAILLINLMGFVSAQFYGGYGRFSFANLLESMDPRTVVFIISFGVFFALLHRIIGKLFRENTTVSAVVSGLLSFGMAYGIYKLDFIDWNGFLFDLGISSDVMWPLMAIIILIVISLMLWKLKSWTFLVLGILMIGLTFTELIYEKGAALIVGFILLIIWLFAWKRTRKKYSWNKEKNQFGGKLYFIGGLLLIVLGGLLGSIWLIILGVLLWIMALIVRINKRRKQNPQGPSSSSTSQGPTKAQLRRAERQAHKENRKRGLKRLKVEAKAYRRIADRQDNPKFYRSWTHFIGYLKGRGYGNNESEILQRLGIEKKDMTKAVKKYIN